jgi:putative addiction module killer protein
MKSPFRDWLEGLDVSVRARIQARVFRFELGNFGDHKSVGRGVWEARLQFGAGYRIYFGRVDNRLIILLSGGDKGSQGRDIQRAQGYLENYLEEWNHG